MPLCAPDYSCVSKRARTVRVTYRQPCKGRIADLVIDSAALKVFGEGEWKVRKHGAEVLPTLLNPLRRKLKSLTPRHGDVVIALLDGGFTVKTLQLKPRLRLLPANPAFAPIDPCMSLSLELFGVVTHVIGNLRQRDGHSAR